SVAKNPEFHWRLYEKFAARDLIQSAGQFQSATSFYSYNERKSVLVVSRLLKYGIHIDVKPRQNSRDTCDDARHVLHHEAQEIRSNAVVGKLRVSVLTAWG